MIDHLDTLLGDWLRPADTPAFAPAVLRANAERQRLLDRLARTIAVDTSSRGVVRVRVGDGGATHGTVARRAHDEILQYLAGERTWFSVPVDLSPVPDFQRRVLEAAATIPFGEAEPYAWVAARIGTPRAVRAVGTALGRNPVPLLVPCHRVRRSDGTAGEYRFGRDLKAALLALERTTPVLVGCARTHVLCRMGCPHARRMRLDQRVVFASVADATSVGYRPCRTCRPEA